ncbi:LemA family protein [Microbacter margulisiae]|uniref:LemA protein n=1 Tax=Microbacter margulisiae TaxID=1350067 RepID=A0A7W5DTA0_9PORP|nr:LemA family protein [Microbacter margulisiae]MBB3188682.1 LemA protein [Microbacter margulisiae]
MKKGVVALVIVVAVLAIFVFWSIGTYNNLVSQDEAVKSQWGNVENVYQRRADLIPNLVATVKGYATHEEKTLTEVVEARAKATQITIDPSKLNATNVAAFEKAQSGLSSALSRLMVTVERYPDLKANQNFLDLQSQLEGTENRIAVERRKYNEVAQQFNTQIRSFPANMVAGLGNFQAKGYFTATQEAQTAPVVKF